MKAVIVVRDQPANVALVGDQVAVCEAREATGGNRVVLLEVIPAEQRVNDGQVVAVVSELDVVTLVVQFEQIAEYFNLSHREYGEAIKQAMQRIIDTL